MIDTIRVTRNVRYAKHHPRNVLDVYEPVHLASGNGSRESLSMPVPCVIYFHGGLWQGGSKDQTSISNSWELIQQIRHAFRHSRYNGAGEKNARGSNDYDTDDCSSKKYSHIGMMLASSGIKTFVANYRLVELHDNQQQLDPERREEPAHPHQVLDVARAISFVLKHEGDTAAAAAGRKTESLSSPPPVFIAGYSAGAHLSSLALADLKYLRLALLEQGYVNSSNCDNQDENIISNQKVNHGMETVDNALQMIRGYIALSGVFNLKRMSHSILKDITLAPAFWGQFKGGGDEGDKSMVVKEQILVEASPVHVILAANKELRKRIEIRMRQISTTNTHIPEPPPPPLLAKLPLLILNAESDFHLHSDAKELVISLEQFDKSAQFMNMHTNNNRLDQRSNDENSKRKLETIAERNHLSIMWEFGSGHMLDCEWAEIGPDLDPHKSSDASSYRMEGQEEITVLTCKPIRDDTITGTSTTRVESRRPRADEHLDYISQVTSTAQSFFSYATISTYQYIHSHPYFGGNRTKDEAASLVVKFIKENTRAR